METPKSTKAGLVFWTPAPFRTSPGSSVMSECEWEDGEEEQADSDDDFTSQMDENGIIGLAEALDDVELGGTRGDAYAAGEADTPPGGRRHNLREHLSHMSPRDDVQTPSPCESTSALWLIPLKLTELSLKESLKNHPTPFLRFNSQTTNDFMEK